MVMPSATFGAQVWHTAPAPDGRVHDKILFLMAQAAMEHIRIFPVDDQHFQFKDPADQRPVQAGFISARESLVQKAQHLQCLCIFLAVILR